MSRRQPSKLSPARPLNRPSAVRRAARIKPASRSRAARRAEGACDRRAAGTAARARAVRPGLTTYRKSSPGAPQAVDVALPRRCSLSGGSERLIADSRPIGTGLLWGPTETQTETPPGRAAPRAARRTGVPAGHRWRKRGDSNPRSLAGRSLSRCSVGRPWGALVLVSGPPSFTLVQLGGIGLWSALMSAVGIAGPAIPATCLPRRGDLFRVKVDATACRGAGRDGPCHLSCCFMSPRVAA